MRYQAALRPDRKLSFDSSVIQGFASTCFGATVSRDGQHQIAGVTAIIDLRITGPVSQAYNFVIVTPVGRYALVAYVKNPVGKFVENLRRELHPELPHMPAHVTVLPPRLLQGNESSAVDTISDICSHVEPFEATLGEMETFIPNTPTVFIRVCHAAQRLRELHHQLNVGALAMKEEWPYMPHMTIIKVATEQQAQKAYLTARKRWDCFREPRTVPISRLTFVREERDHCWLDLATLPLGPQPVATHRR